MGKSFLHLLFLKLTGCVSTLQVMIRLDIAASRLNTTPSVGSNSIDTIRRVLYEVFSIIALDCGDPGTPVNGRTNGRNYTYPNRVTYRCNSGFVLVGLKIRSCQTDGTWSGTLARCERTYMLQHLDYCKLNVDCVEIMCRCVVWRSWST